MPISKSMFSIGSQISTPMQYSHDLKWQETLLLQSEWENLLEFPQNLPLQVTKCAPPRISLIQKLLHCTWKIHGNLTSDAISNSLTHYANHSTTVFGGAYTLPDIDSDPLMVRTQSCTAPKLRLRHLDLAQIVKRTQIPSFQILNLTALLSCQ